MALNSDLPKVIQGQKVFLRDFIVADIENFIRWETVETEWQKWDAPWEAENGEPFDPVSYQNRMLERLAIAKSSNQIRRNFQICIKDQTEKHIGWINAYYIDENFSYTKLPGKLAIGIDIPELQNRRQGYASEAWSLYIDYLLENEVEEVYTQTWSGNLPVIGLMNKLGFVEVNRQKNLRQVRGKLYDGLTFKLDVDKFREFKT
ncbi:MAG: GNAT family N-acetyltransferase [Firmicutes bacterium]|nr:GNAT family N-acetyltransferase [Bacillota bacterium]